MTIAVYEQPREKLARQGAASLSNVELLQVIIGSGNRQASVAKIAKKVAKVLMKSGSSVHPQELLVIQGMGKVKAGQILALFELAGRFPSRYNGDGLNLEAFFATLCKDIKTTSKQILVYVTLDGGKRAITKRQIEINKSISTAKQVQKVFADCLIDSAVSVFIALGYDHQQHELSLYELGLIRDIHKTSQLLSIRITQFLLVSKAKETVLKEMKL